MEVILKEDVAALGSRGDVVKVAEGYGRNFLLPRRLAIEASASNKKVIEQMKAASVRRSAKEKAQAEELSKQFDGLSISFQRKAGEHDQLFGSVTSSDVAEALEKKGFNIDRRKVQIHEALRIQHPEWVEPNGDCPTCDSYESRLAELLGISQRSKAVRMGKFSFLGDAGDY